MTYNPEIHHRRSIRLPGYDYAQPGAYFVTICTHGGECLFGDVVGGDVRLNRLGEIADECWRAIPAHFAGVETDVFVVMPNHVHGIIVIEDVVGTTHVGATHASPLHDTAPSEPASPLQATRTIPNGPKPQSIAAIIGSYKSAVSKRINETQATPGMPVWQRNYWEHVIRDEAELQRIREYIQTNPARWSEDQLHPDARPNRFNQD